MFQKSVLLLSLMGIAIGLLTGILDSLFHFIGFEEYKIINVFIFVLLFTGIYWSVLFFRDSISSGFMTYGSAIKNMMFVGAISSLFISIVRYVYLKHIANININSILDSTEQSMIDHYSLYKEDLINNRLSFIEFSYDPFVSAIFYFGYYMFVVLFFALIASFFLKRIDRNISLY
jgi:uncharacterized protein DUF4199